MVSFEEAGEMEQFGFYDLDDNVKQSNPLGLPSGWYKALTASGKDAGFGFYCDRCKTNVPDHAVTVRHCGKVETRPGTLRELTLPVHTVRSAGIAWI
jgi:hypothetical protein